MSWFKVIKKDNSDDYKIPDDVKSFISDIENAYDESINIKDKMELAEYDSDEEDLEEVEQELEEFSYEVYKLGKKLQVLITKYKIKDMNSSVKDLEGNSPIPVDIGTDEVDYYGIIDELKEHFYVDPYEDKTPKRGNENKKIIERLDDFQTQHYENPFTSPETNQALEELTSAVSNGDVTNLKNRFPEAHLIFDEAGLLSDLE